VLWGEGTVGGEPGSVRAEGNGFYAQRRGEKNHGKKLSRGRPWEGSAPSWVFVVMLAGVKGRKAGSISETLGSENRR